MSKIETVKSSSQQKSKAISEQINELRYLQDKSAEGLAIKVEPLAKALASLAEESKDSILQAAELSGDAIRSSMEKIGSNVEAISTERGKLEKTVSAASSKIRGIELKVVVLSVAASVAANMIIMSLLLIGLLVLPPFPTQQTSDGAVWMQIKKGVTQ